jgi:hypothetical protein
MMAPPVLWVDWQIVVSKGPSRGATSTLLPPTALPISSSLPVTNFDILRSFSGKSKVKRSSGSPHASL